MLPPAEAMRPPPPEKGGKILLEYIPFLWHRMPFRWKMLLRSIFRNPFRSAVSIFAGTISTALIFTAFSNMESLDYLMAFPYGHFIWHLFVLAGSTCHFFAVLWYAA